MTTAVCREDDSLDELSRGGEIQVTLVDHTRVLTIDGGINTNPMGLKPVVAHSSGMDKEVLSSQEADADVKAVASIDKRVTRSTRNKRKSPKSPKSAPELRASYIKVTRR